MFKRKSIASSPDQHFLHFTHPNPRPESQLANLTLFKESNIEQFSWQHTKLILAGFYIKYNANYHLLNPL